MIEPPTLLDFVKATGAAVYADGKLTTIGATPAEADINKLLNWLSDTMTSEVLATDCLSEQFPEAQRFKDEASGLLALRFAAAKKDYLLWFRPEVIQTVNWAGDPRKPVDISNDGQRLLPRASFALWKETVRLKAEPWLDFEIQAVRDLRLGILELIIRKAEHIRDLYGRLEQSYIELDAFAYVASHDLKEPLRGIHNYARFLLEDCAAKLAGEDVFKLESMVRLTQRMESLLDSLLQYSRMSRKQLAEAPCDVNEVVEEVLESLHPRIQESRAEIRIPRRLPNVIADPITLSEIYSNLISNALKYNDKPEKWAEIGYKDDDAGTRLLYVRDNGIGIEAEHLQDIFTIFRRLHGPQEFGGGTGAGLTIARKLAERLGGRMWVESQPGEGSTFYFTARSGREQEAL